jgi:hypothetical protein
MKYNESEDQSQVQGLELDRIAADQGLVRGLVYSGTSQFLESDSDFRERILNYIRAGYSGQVLRGDGKWVDQDTLSEPTKCAHSWKKYQGFTESYHYCEHCDEKK